MRCAQKSARRQGGRSTEGRDKRHNTVRELEGKLEGREPCKGRARVVREAGWKENPGKGQQKRGRDDWRAPRAAAMRTTCNQQCSGVSGLDFNGARRINPGIYTSGTKIEWKRERASFQLFKWIRIVQLDDINPLRWFERGRMDETLMKMIHVRSSCR